jgi:hypothetical protein
MSDSVLKRYMTPQTPREESFNVGEEEGEDDLGSFGWLRGVRDRAIMLELRRKDGSSIAFDYGWLRKIKYDPSEGIMLDFGGEAVQILGRNLNHEVRPNVQLLRGLHARRVPWIQEAPDAQRLKASGDATIIEGFKM